MTLRIHIAEKTNHQMNIKIGDTMRKKINQMIQDYGVERSSLVRYLLDIGLQSVEEQEAATTVNK